jgi:archaellum component FlaC
MKQLKNHKTFTTQNRDPKDNQIDKLKDELKNEKSKTTQMKGSLNSIYTQVKKYKDFIQ